MYWIYCQKICMLKPKCTTFNQFKYSRTFTLSDEYGVIRNITFGSPKATLINLRHLFFALSTTKAKMSDIACKERSSSNLEIHQRTSWTSSVQRIESIFTVTSVSSTLGKWKILMDFADHCSKPTGRERNRDHFKEIKSFKPSKTFLNYGTLLISLIV